MKRVLAINPGSTSTKIGVYDDKELIFEKTLRHSDEEIAQFKAVADQYEFRKEKINEALSENKISLDTLSGIACRGGIWKKIIGGTYIVTEEVVEGQKNAPVQHPANLAAIIGKDMADDLGIKAYFVDSAMSNETHELASFSGHKELPRQCRGHFLNHKAIARKHAEDCGMKYADTKVIVAHLGGGCSIAAHKDGKIVDITDGVSEGPFTPERSGFLPIRELIDLCFSGKYNHKEMKAFIQTEGGMFSYLGTKDAYEVEQRVQKGDENAKLVLSAMAYQISKDIGAMSTVLEGDVDAIILTGGIANSKLVTGMISDRVKSISEVKVYPGEMELEALALGVFRILNGEETPVNN